MGLDQGKQGSRECPELQCEEVTVSHSASGREYLPLLPRETGQGGKAAGRCRPLTEGGCGSRCVHAAAQGLF